MEKSGKSEYRISSHFYGGAPARKSWKLFCGFRLSFPLFFLLLHLGSSSIFRRRRRGCEDRSQEKTGNRVLRFSARSRRIYSALVKEPLIDAWESLFTRLRRMKRARERERERKNEDERKASKKEEHLSLSVPFREERLPQLQRRLANGG